MLCGRRQYRDADRWFHEIRAPSWRQNLEKNKKPGDFSPGFFSFESVSILFALRRRARFSETLGYRAEGARPLAAAE
jgi:hypothetical protein